MLRFWLGDLVPILLKCSLISNISKSKDQTFLHILLAWSVGLCLILNLADSTQLFYYSFFEPSSCRNALKITVKYIFVIFSVCVSELSSRFDRCLCTWNYKRQGSKDADWVPHVGYQGSTWHPDLLSGSYLELGLDLSFIMSSILWLYQTQGLIIICAPVTDVTRYSDKKEET